MKMMRWCIMQHDARLHLKMQAPAQNLWMHQKTRQIIKQLMIDNDISSERQLALECRMSQSTLHRFLKGETESLEFNHLQAIAQRLSLNVSQLIGELPFSADPKLRIVALAMEHMPEYKKDMLVAASHSLAQPDAQPHPKAA